MFKWYREEIPKREIQDIPFTDVSAVNKENKEIDCAYSYHEIWSAHLHNDVDYNLNNYNSTQLSNVCSILTMYSTGIK